ncbi:MAG: hydantoinase/oxoprolinase family protein [Candidatus Scalinduaceae bacterium]
MVILGVDIGGTFTDFVLFNGRGLKIHKINSTPHNPADAVFKGIQFFKTSEEQLNIVHGSTVATNALLERRGAKVALITTKGYEDITEIGRQARSMLYNLFITRKRPLVPGNLRWGLQERVTVKGSVLDKVKENDLRRIMNKLRRNRIEAVAICFLFSYKNPVNEKAVINALKRTGIHISASHKILPEYREYERFSTTIVNAYVSPIMSRYLTSLEDGIGANKISIMQSNGGSISIQGAKERSINCILSGPAGGVIGALRIAGFAGMKRIISFDMGGTSTDVSLCDGDVRMATGTIIGEMPIKIPVIDIFTVGAGGGSTVCIDPGGAMRVGPQSAGVDPGPICYGKGRILTVTDANLFLGRICEDHFLGGRMKLFPDRVSTYMHLFAKKLRIDPVQVAEGIIDIANTNMERAIKVVSIEKGYDVRDFTLFSFGGAGGLHACELASRLLMKRVLIPKNAGVLSAIGMTVADTVKEYSRSVLMRARNDDYDKLTALFRPLELQGTKEILAEGIQENRLNLQRHLDIRYVGQSHELTLPYKKSFINDFHRLHEKSYGYANSDYDVEVVNLRVRATGKTHKPSLNKKSKQIPIKKQKAVKKTRCYFRGRWLKTDIYDRSRVLTGFRIKGPALIVEDTSTTFLPPEYVCNVDECENLIIEKGR